MKKLIIFIFSFLVLFIPLTNQAQAAPGGLQVQLEFNGNMQDSSGNGFHGVSQNAASCSQTDVQAAIDSASAGDTVIVPAGTCTWSSLLLITKEITLQGAGMDNTTIINAYPTNYSGMITVSISSNTDKITRITGFTFQSDQVNESQYHIYVVDESEYRIDNCKFKDGRFYLSKSVAIGGVDTWGVIDHCIFDNEAGEKILVTAGNNTWSEPSTMGSDKATYVEDCVFINSPQGHALVSSYGAKTVFRYNEVHDMDIDAHGHCFRVGQQSARHYEIYENDIYMYNRYGMGMFIRGGTGVIFNNRLYQGKPNSRFTDEIRLTDYRAGTDCPNDGCGQGNEGYPLYDQIGRGMNQESEPLYLWNNQIDLDLDEQMDRSVILIVSNARTLKECGELDAEDFIQDVPHDGGSNPDFYNNETPKPGYTPYEYPHPLIKATETVLNIPDNLKAQAIGAGEVYLWWDEVKDVSGYNIYRDGEKVGIAKTHLFADSKELSEASTYTYMVTSYTDSDESLKSQSATAVTGNIKTAASAAQEDVQAAIDDADDGDTVVIPEEGAIWESVDNFNPAVLIDQKAITLKGAGINKTIISGSDQGGEYPLRVLCVEGKPFRVTGITFLVGIKNVLAIGGTSKYWRIDNCEFKLKESGYNNAIKVSGYTFGIIDHCLFKDVQAVVFHEAIHGAMESNDPWKRPLTLGSANAVYIEDCQIDATLLGGNNIDGTGGARYVVRSNTFINAFFEIHGLQNTDTRGVFSYEIYNNTFTARNGSNWVAAFLRGGTGVLYGNKVINEVGDKYNDFCLVRDYRSVGIPGGWGDCDGTSEFDGNTDGTGYPCMDQIGRSTDMSGDSVHPQAHEPVYSWDNTFDGNPAFIVTDQDNSNGHVMEGRDYYNNTPRPGYTAYVYPHPLIKATDSGSFNIIPAIQLLLLNDEEE